MAFTKARRAPESTAGATSGAVIVRTVCQRPEPRIWADSSIDASTEARALVARRYTNGKAWGTVTRTSPDIEKTLKVSAGQPSTSRTKRLTRPALGLNR